MLTIVNNLDSHLVVPHGAGTNAPLKLKPRGKAAVEKVTGPLKDAERHGLVVIQYPEAKDADDKAPARGKNKKKG